MADGLDIDAMIQRFRDRAHAVKNRTLPPVAGAERTKFIQQAQADFQDFAIIGDAAGRQKLQADALVAVRKIVKARLGRPGVDALYFTSFVMQ